MSCGAQFLYECINGTCFYTYSEIGGPSSALRIVAYLNRQKAMTKSVGTAKCQLCAAAREGPVKCSQLDFARICARSRKSPELFGQPGKHVRTHIEIGSPGECTIARPNTDRHDIVVEPEDLENEADVQLQPAVDFGSSFIILAPKLKEYPKILADLNPEQRALAGYMSEISEEGWHAGWMAHLEYDLWQAITGGSNSFGKMDLTKEHLQTLRSLSERCGGWIVFDDKNEETFVPIDEWKKRYEAHRADSLRRRR
jgi:hypothetical protein